MGCLIKEKVTSRPGQGLKTRFLVSLDENSSNLSANGERLDELARGCQLSLCDRIALIDGGRVVTVGTPEETLGRKNNLDVPFLWSYF